MFNLRFCLGMVLLAMPAALRAETIVDKAHGFIWRVPEDFKAFRNPPVTERRPYWFVLGEQSDDQPNVVLSLNILDAEIDNSSMAEAKNLKEMQFRLSRIRWKEHTIEVLERAIEFQGIEMCQFCIWIPLRNQAIQVDILGPVNRADEVRKYLPKIVEGFSGESSWSASESETTDPDPNAYGTVSLGVFAAIIVGGLVCCWLISRVTPPGTVVMIGAGLWVFSAALLQAQIRELLILGSASRILGIAACILGAIDYARKKKSSQIRGDAAPLVDSSTSLDSQVASPPQDPPPDREPGVGAAL